MALDQAQLTRSLEGMRQGNQHALPEFAAAALTMRREQYSMPAFLRARKQGFLSSLPYALDTLLQRVLKARCCERPIKAGYELGSAK